MSDLKQEVREFWNEAPCGEVYAQGEDSKEKYEAHRQARYELEPVIPKFAKFESGKGLEILEVGVGMGADHIEWAKSSPKKLCGIDITQSGIDHTQQRLAIHGLSSNLQVGDAENLPFEDESFDMVYSWGVVHHSPNTQAAINEIHRVLRPNGTAKIMVYHKYSMVGFMLWARYALARGKIFTSLDEIFAKYMESPGTKAYSKNQGKQLLQKFSEAKIETQLSFGDVLEGSAGQRHQGIVLKLAKMLYPRFIIKTFFKTNGIYLLMEAKK